MCNFLIKLFELNNRITNINNYALLHIHNSFSLVRIDRYPEKTTRIQIKYLSKCTKAPKMKMLTNNMLLRWVIPKMHNKKLSYITFKCYAFYNTHDYHVT